jgi:hypothetical protein
MSEMQRLTPASSVEESYSRLEPQRVFQGCKIAEDERYIVVRIYSQSRVRPMVMPPPYRIYRFDPATGSLTPLTAGESTPYTIQNYK